MRSLDSVFKRIPVPGEREQRSKRTVTRALENPRVSVEKMADDFFQPYLVAGLKNSVSSMLNIRELLVAHPDQMELLSDFVTICVMFVYSRPQHRQQAISFLRSTEAREFKFLNVELVNLMKLMIMYAPSNLQELKQSGEIIADMCMKSEACADNLETIMTPGHYRDDENEIALLTETAKVMRSYGNDSPLFVKFANGEVKAGRKTDQSREPSPVERLYKIQERKGVNRFFSDILVPHRVFWYVMIFLAILVILILATM